MNISNQIREVGNQLSSSYHKLMDEAIYRNVRRVEGEFPAPSVFESNAMIVHCSAGSERWTEFKWRDKTIFKIGLEFSQEKVSINVTDMPVSK